MADSTSQSRSNRLPLTILGIIALLALAYAILRVDILRARIATLEVHRDEQVKLNASLQVANQELIAANLATQEQLKHVAALDVEMTNLSATIGELRGRTEQSQRNWTRVETLYLLRLAENQLQVTHDVPSALSALQAAESRINLTRDPTLDGVRAQLKSDIESLRNVAVVDRTQLYSQLDQAQVSAMTLKALGTVIDASVDNSSSDNHAAGIERAWWVFKQSIGKLFLIRKVDTSTDGLLTAEDQLQRRRHLQLLLLSIKQAAELNDGNTFRGALKQTQAWLTAAFDSKDKQVAALSQQLAGWEKLDIQPALPDISGARKLLEKYSPGATS
jgi:uroporphyrin-3 C-methyltransferase